MRSCRCHSAQRAAPSHVIVRLQESTGQPVLRPGRGDTGWGGSGPRWSRQVALRPRRGFGEKLPASPQSALLRISHSHEIQQQGGCLTLASVNSRTAGDRPCACLFGLCSGCAGVDVDPFLQHENVVTPGRRDWSPLRAALRCSACSPATGPEGRGVGTGSVRRDAAVALPVAPARPARLPCGCGLRARPVEWLSGRVELDGRSEVAAAQRQQQRQRASRHCWLRTDSGSACQLAGQARVPRAASSWSSSSASSLESASVSVLPAPSSGRRPAMRAALRVLAIAVLAAAAHAQRPVRPSRQQRPEACTTPAPDRLPGSCVTLHSCPPLLQLLQGGRPPSREVVDFLRKSHCGFVNHEPKVCCPGLDPTTPPRPNSPQQNFGSGNAGKPPPERPPPPPPNPTGTAASGGPGRPANVANEPNLRLLPHDVCGPISSFRIINGKKTVVFEFPWMARLGYKSIRTGKVSYLCGGSLINSRYVLSAAHCVEVKSSQQLVTVRLGEHDILNDTDCSIISGTEVCAPKAIDVGVEEAISHPDFSLQGPNRLQNDVALIRLERAVPFSDAVRPICLPVGKDQSNDLNDNKVIVAGWGTTETGYNSRELLKVAVPIVPGAKCVDLYKSEVRIVPATQICAGGTKEGDSCNGDSGGPLKYAGTGVAGDPRYVQYGIVSFGPRRCGSEGMPGVYTRVGYYMQWILRNLRP